VPLGPPSEAADAQVLAGYGLGSSVANGRVFASLGRHLLACSCRLVERAMDYDQIDVLDKGTVWQEGALDAARGPEPSQLHRHRLHCRALGISADDAPASLRAQRPIADPNPGFLAQLQQLWP
jgi:hypothetical protein